MENRYRWKSNYYDESKMRYPGYNFDVIDRENEKIYRVRPYISNYEEAMRIKPEYYAQVDNQEFWNFVCATAPDACRHVPEKFQTPELMRIIANNTSDPHNLKKIDMARVVEEEGREAAVEIYEIMVQRFCDALSDVPEEYLTDSLFDLAINTHSGALSKLPVERRTIERCIASVSKYGTSLRSVPEEKRGILVETEDGIKSLFEIAVEVNSLSLASVPNKDKTAELCIKALKKNVNAIKYVPATLITPEFIELVKSNNIVIPPKYRFYIQECLKVHGKINYGLDFGMDNFEVNCSDDNSKFEEISLDQIPYMFSKTLLAKLKQKGITTLGALFTEYEDPDFVTKFSSQTYAEISGVVNVLNCKFKGKDPQLDLQAMSYQYMVSKLGFSPIVAKKMELRELSIIDLLIGLERPYEQQVWSQKIRGVGEALKNESLVKLMVVADYYAKKRAEKDLNKEEEINRLKEELRVLQHQARQLDLKINATVERIAELSGEKVATNNGMRKRISPKEKVRKMIGVNLY